MTFSKKNQRDYTIDEPYLIEKLSEFYEMFNTPLKGFDKDILQQFNDATNGNISTNNHTAWVVNRVKRNNRRYVQFSGRVGLRVKLSQVLQGLFDSSSEYLIYIDKLLACGEIYHLNNFIQLFSEIEDRNNTNQEIVQYATLHLEAALFLRKDRLNNEVTTAGSEELIDRKWVAVRRILFIDEYQNEFSAVIATRLCNVIIDFSLQDKNNFSLTSELDELLSDIKQHFLVENNSKTVWSIFVRDIQSTLNRLPNFGEQEAEDILNAKLHQEWLLFPDEIKYELKQAIVGFPEKLFQMMCHVNSEDELIHIVKKMKYRPELIVPNLAIMAITDIRQNEESKNRVGLLSSIADALLEIRESLLVRSKSLYIGVVTECSDNALKAARKILLTDASRTKLIVILGENRALDNSKNISLPEEAVIEGLALGSHSLANSKLGEVEEIKLMSSEISH